MEYRELEARLYNHPQLKSKIKYLGLCKIEINNEAPYTAIVYDGMPKGNDTSDPTATTVENKLKRIKAIDNQLAKLQIECDKINIALSCLNNLERQVVTKKYFDNLTWVEIGLDVNLSSAQCQRVRKDSMIKMLNVLDAKMI